MPYINYMFTLSISVPTEIKDKHEILPVWNSFLKA